MITKALFPSRALLGVSLLVGLVAGCGGSSGVGSQVAALTVVSGDAQSAVVGSELPDALVVAVTDDAGQPVAGQVVNFHVTSGGGFVFAGAASTDQNGIAKERWTLGTDASAPQKVEARWVDSATGNAVVSATFTATALPAESAGLQARGGDHQSALAGDAVAEPCTVRVVDSYGNPVPGQSVTWSAQTGGGAAAGATSTTDSNGEASMGWSLGSELGGQTLLAQAAGQTVTFHAALVTRLTISAASQGQVADPGNAVTVAPEVTAWDENGAAAPSIPISFAVTDGGGEVIHSQAITDADGKASAGDWTLGGQNGLNVLEATAGSLPIVTFVAAAGPTSSGIDIWTDTMETSPHPDAEVSEHIVMTYWVDTTFALSSVVASIGDTSVALSSQGGVWGGDGVTGLIAYTGAIDIAPREAGTLGLIVTATDVNGNATSEIVPLAYAPSAP